MKLFRDIDSITPAEGGRATVATVGTFDGVHRGHRAVIDRCVAVGRESNRRSLVVTFSGHPLSLLAPPHAPPLLTTTERKIELFRAAGPDAAACLPFDEAMAAMSAEAFTQLILFDRCGAKVVVCGHDFNFGKSGAGDPETIRSLGLREGVEVIVATPLSDADQPISSTRIREALMEGKVEEAATLLGRPYDLSGQVVAGERRGTRLEFPTANLLAPAGQCIPLTGVYAVRAITLDGRRWSAMMNIGRAPTFGVGENRLEVHLLDFEGNLYGSRLRVEFVARLRAERKFDSAEALVAQLRRDRRDAMAFLG